MSRNLVEGQQGQAQKAPYKFEWTRPQPSIRCSLSLAEDAKSPETSLRTSSCRTLLGPLFSDPLGPQLFADAESGT
jgi:hypothetical protein